MIRLYDLLEAPPVRRARLLGELGLPVYVQTEGGLHEVCSVRAAQIDGPAGLCDVVVLVADDGGKSATEVG